MRSLPIAAVGGLLFVGTLSAQSKTIQFADPTGLSAEAEFTLLGGGTSLQVNVRNTSTNAPAGFDSSDQILTGISWDFGSGSGVSIIGGSVLSGPTSQSINFSVQDVGPNEDVSGEYGYGNGGATGMMANVISGNSANMTPFGGANLDGPDSLNGPQGGLVSVSPPVSIGGQGVIQDEIVATVQLDSALSDLSFLDATGATVEYGSDAYFQGGFPDCDEVASVTKVNDAGGLNAENGLCASPGSLPTLGNPAFKVQLDDPGNLCGITPGAVTVVLGSFRAGTALIPGLGCAPGSPGELMIDFQSVGLTTGPVAWGGPGQPACHTIAIPDDPNLCGITCFFQGGWIDIGGTSGPGVLTNRLDAIIGS